MSTDVLTSPQIYWDLRSKTPRLPYDRMVVAERSELWRPKTQHEEPYFVETTIIWRAGTEFFLQHTPFQYEKSVIPEFTDGEIRRIDASHLYPDHKDYLMADSEENRFVEVPTCIEYDYRTGPFGTYPRDAFSRQAEVIAPLLNNPHRNVTEFYGCLTEWYWMDGLVFGQYSRSLADFGPDEVLALDATGVLEGIKNGVKHLHQLGIMHMAIFPQNIRFDGNGRPIIVNFRNALWKGSPVTYETIELIEHAWAIYRASNHQNPEPFVPGPCFQSIKEDHPLANPEIDYFGVLVMQDFLRHPRKYQEFTKLSRKIWWDCRKDGHIGETCCQIGGRDNVEPLPCSNDDYIQAHHGSTNPHQHHGLRCMFNRKHRE